jgi:hypothetical protein
MRSANAERCTRQRRAQTHPSRTARRMGHPEKRKQIPRRYAPRDDSRDAGLKAPALHLNLSAYTTACGTKVLAHSLGAAPFAFKGAVFPWLGPEGEPVHARKACMDPPLGTKGGAPERAGKRLPG